MGRIIRMMLIRDLSRAIDVASRQYMTIRGKEDDERQEDVFRSLKTFHLCTRAMKLPMDRCLSSDSEVPAPCWIYGLCMKSGRGEVKMPCQLGLRLQRTYQVEYN